MSSELKSKAGRQDPRLVAMLRTAVLGFAFCAFAWDISTGVGQAAIILGTLVGGMLAHRLSRSRQALWRVWAMALGVMAGGLAISWTMTNTVAFSVFNPAAQLNFAEFFRLGSLALGLVMGLRTQSARYPALVAVEFGLAAVGMASSLAMHRDGAINRPTELGDYAWGAGADPARYIVYAGLVASVAALLMLFRERRIWKTVVHLAVMALLFGGVMALVDEVELPDPASLAEKKPYNPEQSEPWLDPDLKPEWGPSKGPLDGQDPGGEGKGKPRKPGEGKEGGEEEGQGKNGQGEDEGDRPSPLDDPWSEFDDEYIAEQSGQGEGEGEGDPSSGGGGSGNSKKPWDESFNPDTDDTQTPPGGGKLTQVYTPDIIPLDRGNVFDGLDEKESFTHRSEERKPLKLSKPLPEPKASFDGDVRLRLRPGYVTPLPSVSPDMVITSYEAEPPMEILFSKDDADNYWVSSETAGIVRVRFKVEAPMSYFGGKLPEKIEPQKVPRRMLMPLPDSTRQDAEEVMTALGITKETPPKEAFLKMVEYFRTYEDVAIPAKPDDVGYYKHLALVHKGVCRHRAYAFVITANAYGLPTRFVTNDIHAYAETWLPGYGWLQLDLGGRELNMQVTGPSESDPFIPPRSELPEPENFKENREAFQRNVQDPSRRRAPREPRKRLTPEEFAQKYPDRCRKKREKPSGRQPKHGWGYTRGAETPMLVSVLRGEYAPPSGNYYFREEALSFYDGCRFMPSRRRDTDQDLLDRYPRGEQVTEVSEKPPIQHRSALDMTTGDLGTRRRPAALEGVFVAKNASNPDPSRFHRVYDTQHLVQTTPFDELLGRDVGDAAWNGSRWRYYLKAPMDTRYAELANTIIEAKLPEDRRGDPLAQAAALLAYLEEEGTWDTSKSWADDQTEDPAAAFLFGDKHGHAVHFATAMALLLRTRGVPTRLVEGYVSPESNRRGGSAVLLREADAHVWPEIYVREIGWVPVDPVPQRSVSEGVAPPDPELQRMLGEMLRGRYQPNDAGKGKEGERERSSLGAIGRAILQGFGWLALLAVLLVMPATLAVKVWRRVTGATARGGDAARLVFRATLDRLAEAGLVREFGEPREAFARRMEAQVPTLGAHTNAHLKSWLGSREATPPEEHKRLAAQVAAEVRRAVPWWRRVVGFFNPLTLWRAR